MHVVSLERVQDCSKLPNQQFNHMQNTYYYIELRLNVHIRYQTFTRHVPEQKNSEISCRTTAIPTISNKTPSAKQCQQFIRHFRRSDAGWSSSGIT